MKPPGNGPFVPPRTRAELSSPAPPGGRHGQMLKLVLPLLGAGLSREAVFRATALDVGPNVSDREIRNLIEWASAKNPQPCGWKPVGGGVRNFRPAPALPERVTARASDCQRQRVAGRFPL